MTDITTEQAIQAAGANVAPRITPDDIKANIVSEHYFTGSQAAGCGHNIGSGGFDSLRLLTFCVLVLRNGFTVTGESACASPENFNADIGRSIARQNAVAKIWPLMGYALKENLHNLAHGPAEWPEPSGKILTDADAAADLAGITRPSAAVAHHPV